MTKQKSHHVDAATAVGKRLRDARESAGLSQSGLAGSACSPAYISRIEVGARVPSLQLLRQLGKRLGVSADYLATGLVAGDAAESARLDAEVALRLDDLTTATRLYEAALEDTSEGLTRSEALAGLGQIALRQGRHHVAIELLEEAAEAGSVDLTEQPGIAESLARAYAMVGELSPAIALLERCVEKYEASDDLLQFIKFASMLGYALTDNGDLAGAERIVARTLARGHEVIDPYARARLFWSQSRLLIEQAQPAAAERYARKTLETLRVTEDTYAVAHAIEMLAHICLELGRPGEALELLDEGEPLIRGAGSPPEIAHFQLERARALAVVGEREEAASLAMQVAGQLKEMQPVGRGRAYLLLADLFRDLGDSTRAQELYELAIEFTEEGAPSKHLASAYRALADLLKKQGKRDEALDLLERALTAQAVVGTRGG
jgi:tetratricopeptide (TPR) repeat protein